MSRSRSARSTVVVAGLISIAVVAAAQPRAGSAPARAAAPGTVAMVGTLPIPRAELDMRVQQAFAEYRQRSGTEVPEEFKPIVERQMLESLIRGRLLLIEASRQHLVGSVADAEAVLRRDPFFLDNGRFSEAKFQATKTRDPVRFQAAVEQIRAQLGAQLLSQRLEKQYSPAVEALRARATRDLARAHLSFLALRYRDFDGGYDEPRESEVLADYQAHRDQYRRPERARLTVVFVDRPELPDSLAKDADAMKAWQERLRPRADSALAALEAGASIDSVGARYGGVRRDLMVARGSFPTFWAGDARAEQAVFAAAPGALLPQPVAARPGWLLVRVEERVPPRIAALAEVAPEIRTRLRLVARDLGDERRLRAWYESRVDSLVRPGAHVRYAAFDASRVPEPRLSAADVDRFYRGHLADYSSYDARKGTIVAKPLAEVRDDVARRLSLERREEVAREAAETVYRAWSSGRRAPAAERAAALLRELGAVAEGMLPDTGLAGSALRDSLAGRGMAPGAGVGSWANGRLVWQVYDPVPRVRPTYEQARPQLAEEFRQHRDVADEAGGRALWEKDPNRFAGGPSVYLGRLLVPMPPLITVPLTRAEVERWHREHIDQYAAGEAVEARHIMIAPKDDSPAAVEAARQKALEIERRIKAGESFADLARQYSDDMATRDKGGDLGTFGRGAMLDAFEKAVFAMKPGQISDPVRTEVGWHVIECLKYLPAEADPLSMVYVNVGGDAARAKAERIALARADSLLSHLRTPEQAKALARRSGFDLLPLRIQVGAPVGLPDMVAYIRRIERMKPGEMYPSLQPVRGQGYLISWVDSVGPPPTPTWDAAREKAIVAYRAGAAERTILAKRAELDSMLARGWSLDSLGALFGGLESVPELAAGGQLPGLGAAPSTVDSLVFGGARPAVLKENEVSDWIPFPSGFARLRVDARAEPVPTQITARTENERRAAVEKSLRGYFDGLKKRHGVRILDPRLKDINLPQAPPINGG